MRKLMLGVILVALVAALPATVMTKEKAGSPSRARGDRSESAGSVLRSYLGGSFESRVTSSVGAPDGTGRGTERTDGRNDPGFGLLPSFPNPFNPTTTISCRLPEAAEVTLAVYDVSGRLVRTFDGFRAEAGVAQTVVWNGTDDGGRTLPSGIYLLMMRTKTFTQVSKLVLLK